MKNKSVNFNEAVILWEIKQNGTYPKRLLLLLLIDNVLHPEVRIRSVFSMILIVLVDIMRFIVGAIVSGAAIPETATSALCISV